jgi:hypothetical protein
MAVEKEEKRPSLTFRCTVQDGEGAYSRMVFPGRDQVAEAHHLENSTSRIITMCSKAGAQANIIPAVKCNDDKKPLVMAYIGQDHKNRGDSKAAIGLARLVAEMVNGWYVYLDSAIVHKDFPWSSSMTDPLKEYFKHNDNPDIVIGRFSNDVAFCARQKPMLVESSIGEALSFKRLNNRELVAHDLRRDVLARESNLFRQHYPDVKRPLIAVMMGGHVFSCDVLARKLIQIGTAYPEATFFLCPSLRTGRDKDELKQKLKEEILNAGAAAAGIKILGIDYEDAISEARYNPYMGLLATADHIVVAGESYSLVSEALFSGKNAYLFRPQHAFAELTRQGYVQDILTLESGKPFPTVPMEPPDLTRLIAQSIAAEFREKIRHSARPLPLRALLSVPVP